MNFKQGGLSMTPKDFKTILVEWEILSNNLRTAKVMGFFGALGNDEYFSNIKKFNQERIEPLAIQTESEMAEYFECKKREIIDKK